MNKPIEALAQEYVEQAWFDLEYSSFGTTAKECQKAFMAGAKAASGRVAELEEALRFYADEDNWSNERDNKCSTMIGGGDHEQKKGQNYFIGGKLARQALSGAGKGEG